MFSSSVVYVGHQRQMPCSDCVAWYYGLGMAFLAIAAPSLPCLLGITALFARYSLSTFGCSSYEYVLLFIVNETFLKQVRIDGIRRPCSGFLHDICCGASCN